MQRRTALRAGDEASIRAKRLRRDATLPERMLWSRLKGKQLGVKFRRQHPLGPFIADFFCDEIGLVVEIDSSAHDSRGERDRSRDGWMAERGLSVLRFQANDVIQRVEGVLEAIHASVEKRKAEIQRMRPEKE